MNLDHVDISVERADHKIQLPAAPVQLTLTLSVTRSYGAERVRLYRIRCRTAAAVKHAVQMIHGALYALDGTMFAEEEPRPNE